MNTKDSFDLVIMPAKNGLIVRERHGPFGDDRVTTGDVHVFNDISEMFVFIEEHFVESQHFANPTAEQVENDLNGGDG